MTRVFALGYAPLPFEDTVKNIAPGNRTWQLIQPLLDDGHDICLIAFRIPNAYINDPPNLISIPDYPRLIYYSLPSYRLYDTPYLQELMENFQPDCVLGIMTEASSYLARINPSLPFWADLYGSAIAEAQIQAHVKDSNHQLQYVLASEKQILQSADKISTVSSNQRFAVIGELGLVGRLNSYTTGYEFVHVMPTSLPITQVSDIDISLLREHNIPEDSFVILSSGGYNNWTDEEILFNGIVGAIQQDTRIHFISTGGQIEGHDDYTYHKFTARVQQSIYKDHFHLLSWVNQPLLRQLYQVCDVGIIADKSCYETELGSRTRLMAWVDAGLVPIINPIAEIAIAMINANFAFSFPQGDADHLSDTLINLASNPTLLNAARQHGESYFKEQYSIDQTTAPLVNWIGAGYPHAPDYQKNITLLLLDADQSNQNLPFTRSWFEVLQPVWSKLIFDLSRSRFRFIVPPLKTASRLFKQRKRS